MQLLPAVLIGGPPHSGKSVLTYHLTRALRQRGVAHYVLRAFPDGEGDWFFEADMDLVRQLRARGEGSQEWIARVGRDIDRRHLPLIVDVGGRPTDWQAALFGHCTHAILLTPDARTQMQWRHFADRHSLPLLADLRSALHQPDSIFEQQPVLRGRIGGLERAGATLGVTFEALVEALAALFAYDHSELRALHLAHAPADLVIELEQLGRSLAAGQPWTGWQPEQLRTVLTYAPAHAPLAIYERGPNWLYAALAVHTLPRPLYQFDPRLGWISAPILRVQDKPHQTTGQPGTTEAPSLLALIITQGEGYLHLAASLPQDYLDYDEVDNIVLPALPKGMGVILSGKLPLWLYTGLARAYHTAPWLGVYQPQMGNQAVVIASRTRQRRIGQRIPLE
jgi:CRISPR-associated protein Csx3